MRLLHLEDNPHDRALVAHALRATAQGWEIVPVASRPDYVEALSTGTFDAILADFHVPGFDGFEALSLGRQLAPRTPFLFVSGAIGEDQAIATLHAGADDYILKDRMKRLPTALQRLVTDYRERELRRQTEAALLASQTRYTRMVEQARDAVFSLSLTGIITSLNPAFETMTGWPRTRWIGHHFAELVAERDRAAALERFATLASTHRPDSFVLHINSGRDAELIVELSVTYTTGTETDAPVEILGIARDVTARQRAEAVIREQAEIIEHAPAAIVIIGLDHRVRYWNRGAEALYGWTAAEAIGHTAEQLFDPCSAASLATGRTATLLTGFWRGEVRVNVKDQRCVDAEVSMSLIRDEAGIPTGRLSVALDVTEKKRLEEQFMRAQRMENLGLLAAGIAHDLNNIFAPILMVSQLLRDDLADTSHTRLLTMLDQSAQRGVDLVKQILSLARGTAGGNQPLNLKHLARDIGAMIEETFPKNIEFTHHIATDLWTIRANPTYLHQILLNLCVNARDAMPTGGRLGFRLHNRELDAPTAATIPDSRPGRFVVVEVEDTGVGIAPDLLPRIWEPFFTTKQPGQGTGLGLSTVRGIVQNLGGFLSVESTLGRGSRFTLYFPADQDTPAPASSGDSPRPCSRGHGELILVVEDEPGVRELTADLLTAHGYTVRTAPDGVAALELLQGTPPLAPALVITDLAMPRLGGEALLPLLRRDLPGVPLVVASGLSDGQTTNLPPGLADAFLIKPFQFDALLDTIKRLLPPAPP